MKILIISALLTLPAFSFAQETTCDIWNAKNRLKEVSVEKEHSLQEELLTKNVGETFVVRCEPNLWVDYISDDGVGWSEEDFLWVAGYKYDYFYGALGCTIKNERTQHGEYLNFHIYIHDQTCEAKLRKALW